MTPNDWLELAATILVPMVLAIAAGLIRLVRDVGRLQGEVHELSRLLRSHLTLPTPSNRRIHTL